MYVKVHYIHTTHERINLEGTHVKFIDTYIHTVSFHSVLHNIYCILLGQPFSLLDPKFYMTTQFSTVAMVTQPVSMFGHTSNILKK